jgi:hypothetical protein
LIQTSRYGDQHKVVLLSNIAIFALPNFIPTIFAFQTYTSEPTAGPQKLFAYASEHDPKLLARAEKGYIYSYQRFVKYNHFNPRFDVKWKRVSLDNLCIYQIILYASLLEHLNASDMVISDHDSYEHDGGGVNLI